MIDKDKNLLSCAPNGAPLPWSHSDIGASSYRISLAILRHTDVIYPLLSLLNLQSAVRKFVFPPDQRTFLASFDVDPNGVPLTATATLHSSLAAVKTHEMDGNLQKLLDYHQKAIDAFRKKLDTGAPLNHDKLEFIINWLQTFLPRGCKFTHEITVDMVESTSSPWAPTRFTLSQKSTKIQGALLGYVRFLLNINHSVNIPQGFNPLLSPNIIGRKYSNCTFWWAETQTPTWPTNAFSNFPSALKTNIVELKRKVFGASEEFHALSAGTENARTQVVAEVAAHYLVTYAQLLPRYRNDLARINEKIMSRPPEDDVMGVVVFSANTEWLDELEQKTTLFQTDGRDTLASYPLATYAPQAAIPDAYCDESAYFKAKEATDEMTHQLNLRDRLVNALIRLRNELHESAKENPEIKRQLAALDNPTIPPEITQIEREIRQSKQTLTNLKKRHTDLKTTRAQLRKSDDPIPFSEAESLLDAIEKTRKSIQLKELEVAGLNNKINGILARQRSKLENDRLMLCARLPNQIIDYRLQELERNFDRSFLKTYRCLSIKNPDDIQPIIDKLTSESYRISLTWPIRAARTIRAFVAQNATAYRDLFAEYENFDRQSLNRLEDRKRLLTLHKHMFLLYPIRLVPLDRSASYLTELAGGKLMLAIIDGTRPPHYQLLTQICKQFKHVLLLDGEKEHIMDTSVPQELKTALRRKHQLTDFPSYM